MKNEKVRLILDETDGFPFRVRKEPDKFDVIVIDSYGYSYDCAVEAIEKLAAGGMVILDNLGLTPHDCRCVEEAWLDPGGLLGLQGDGKPRLDGVGLPAARL